MERAEMSVPLWDACLRNWNVFLTSFGNLTLSRVAITNRIEQVQENMVNLFSSPPSSVG